MEDHTLRNWHGYYQPPRSGLNRSLPTKPLFNNQHGLGRNHQDMVNINYNDAGVYYPNRVDDMGLQDPRTSHDSIPVDVWGNQQRDVIVNMNLSDMNLAYGGLCEASGSQGLQILQQPETLEKESMVRTEELPVNGNGPLKKRPGGGRAHKSPKRNDDFIPTQRASRPARRKSTGVNINGVDIDISGIPIPICSCTRAPQQCYRWGSGGWQSACCTTSISMYPLPMSNKRRGARIAGRKMSQGAFKKVLEKLATEGYNLSNPIDLRTHWAKHGTNRFVTIR